MSSVVETVAYLQFASATVAAVNRAWRENHPDCGEVLMEREGLHFHLYCWGVATGRIPGAERPRTEAMHVYVSRAYRDDAPAVVAEARNYWRTIHRQRRAAVAAAIATATATDPEG